MSIPSKVPIYILLAFAISASSAEVTRTQAVTALARGIDYFHSLSNRGGYVYYVTPDLSRRWGEGVLDTNTIEVQPPGTPTKQPVHPSH